MTTYIYNAKITDILAEGWFIADVDLGFGVINRHVRIQARCPNGVSRDSWEKVLPVIIGLEPGKPVDVVLDVYKQNSPLGPLWFADIHLPETGTNVAEELYDRGVIW